MKVLFTACALLFSLFLFSQEETTRLQATKVIINDHGEKQETSTVKPVVVTIDYGKKTVTIETSNQDITKLFKGQMVRKLQGQMGARGVKYSLQLDDNILLHVHNDTRMILFTRSDIHPLQWGLQLKEFERAGE